MSQEKRHVVSPVVKMFAGSLGGIVEATLCQPLDVIKTRLQLDSTKKYKGVANCFQTIVREEGARALYKGLSPLVAHLTLKYALRLGSFGLAQDGLRYAFGKKSEGPIGTFFAGLTAGALEAVLIVTPFEVIKTRLQDQRGTAKQNLKYKGALHCATTILREEGLSGLGRGMTATVIRQASNQATGFLAVHMMNFYVWHKKEGDGTQLSVAKTLTTGFVAGAVGPLLNQPFDLAKSRLQAQCENGKKRRYQSTLHCIMRVGQEEGIRSLYRGLAPRLARVAPGQAIMWSVVLKVQAFFERKGLENLEQEVRGAVRKRTPTRTPTNIISAEEK